MRSERLRAACLILVAVAALAACGQPPMPMAQPETTPEPFEACCTSPERLPSVIGTFALDVAPVFGPLIGSHKMRDGYLAHPAEVKALVKSDLRPLDNLLISSRNFSSGAIIPGRFTHVMLYLGTEQELKRLRVWDDPKIVPHHAKIRAGKHLIESDSHGTKLLDLKKAVDTDLMAVLRPRNLTRKAKARAVRSAFDRLGDPYGFQFDLSDCSRSFCTSLVHRALPELKLRVQVVYGRPTLLPDEFASAALDPKGQLQLIRYLRGTKEGWQVAGANQLARDVNSYWQTPPPFAGRSLRDHTAPKVNLCAAGHGQLSLPDGRAL